MSVVVFDLEWTRGQDDIDFNEIVQIGAVKVDCIGAIIADTYCTFIQPSVHSVSEEADNFFPFSIDELYEADGFNEEFWKFLSWCGEDVIFATWGSSDFDVLLENISYYNFSYSPPSTYCNIQTSFSNLFGIRRRLSLAFALEYCNVPTIFEFHDALNDAFYTSIIGSIVVKHTDLLFEPVNKEQRIKNVQEKKPDIPDYLKDDIILIERKLSGLNTTEAFLNNRAVRKHNCPVCGKLLAVSFWLPLGDSGYISRTSCPIHGCYYFYTIPQIRPSGKWAGYVMVLQNSNIARSTFSACDKTQIFLCKRLSRSKKSCYFQTKKAP